jgi:hypothetical protein
MSLVLMELPMVRCGDMILEQEVMVWGNGNYNTIQIEQKM